MLYGNPQPDDIGNCVRFLTEEESKTVFVPDAPLLSTTGDEHWYQISFNRSGKAIEYVPDSAVLKQNTVDEENFNQYWKITGASHDDCKIENYSGGAVKGNGVDRYMLGTVDEGHSFKFERNGSDPFTHWQLYNNTATVNKNRYLNDEKSKEVTGYSKGDAGAYLVFTSVTAAPEFSASVSTLDTLDFDISPINIGTSRELSVAGRNLSDTISYEVTGTDSAAFIVTTEGWIAKRGGKLTVTFTPTENKTYAAMLTIKTEGQPNIVIPLSGKGFAGPILTVDSLALNFGDVTTGLDSETKATAVSIANAVGDIAYEKTGSDTAAFVITESSRTAAAGGTLNVVFKPTEAKEYSASIEITGPGAETQTVTLTGRGVNTELPVFLSTADNDIWYYIEVNNANQALK